MRAVVALFAALAVGLVGCGGADVGAGPASSAGLLTPGALVYWQTVSDPDSEQWQQAEDLLGKFPDGDRWIAQLKRELEEEGVTWEGDVEPALGSVVDFVVYGSTGTESPSVVVLTNPEDEDKLLELVRKVNEHGDEPAVSRVVGDWVVISESEAAIDAALKDEGGQALADDDAFRSALDDLPDDALTRVYVDPARALELVGPGAERKALATLGLDDLDFAGAWLKAKDEGAELAIALRGEGADRLLGSGEPYSSKLLDKVPDDAFAFVTFQGAGLSAQLQRIRGNPMFELGLQEFERESGIDVNELIALLDGEIALYVRPAAGLPEFTLLLDSQNPDAAKASLERLLRGVTEHLHGVEFTVGAVDGIVVVSTQKDAIAELQQSGDKLPDSQRYKSALDAAGAPDQYTGLAYVDVTEAWDLIRSYLGVRGTGELPPAVGRNLEPLQSLVAYGTQDGNLSTGLVFVEIE